MKTKQISVFMENRPNALAEFCHVLRKENISMRAMCLADTKDFGILRLIVDDAYKTANILKDEGFICSLTNVLTVEVEDQPGALTNILDILGGKGINIEYSYAFLSKTKGKAYIVLRVSNTDEAIKLLECTEVSIIEQEDFKDVFGG